MVSRWPLGGSCLKFGYPSVQLTMRAARLALSLLRHLCHEPLGHRASVRDVPCLCVYVLEHPAG